MTPTFQAMRSPAEGLTVVGEASHDIAPEMIELGFEIHTVGVSAAMAVQENVAKTKQIGQALALIAVAEADIKTGATEVMPILQLPNPPLAPVPNPLLLQSAYGPFKLTDDTVHIGIREFKPPRIPGCEFLENRDTRRQSGRRSYRRRDTSRRRSERQYSFSFTGRSGDRARSSRRSCSPGA